MGASQDPLHLPLPFIWHLYIHIDPAGVILDFIKVLRSPSSILNNIESLRDGKGGGMDVQEELYGVTKCYRMR